MSFGFTMVTFSTNLYVLLMVAALKTATKELRMRKMTSAELSFMIVLLWSRSMSKNLGWTNNLGNILLLGANIENWSLGRTSKKCTPF